MKEGTKQVKFCIHCGAEFPSGAKFCPDCGKAVETVPKYSATDNPVVAGTASVLSDPIKRRVAFVAAAVVVVLVLGIALLAGGREAAPQGGDLPDAPPVSDEAEGSGETIPQDEGQEEVQHDGQEEVIDPSVLPYLMDVDPSGEYYLAGEKTALKIRFKAPEADLYTVAEEYVALLEQRGYTAELTEAYDLPEGWFGDVKLWTLRHPQVEGNAYVRYECYRDYDQCYIDLGWDGEVSFGKKALHPTGDAAVLPSFDRYDPTTCFYEASESSVGKAIYEISRYEGYQPVVDYVEALEQYGWNEVDSNHVIYNDTDIGVVSSWELRNKEVKGNLRIKVAAWEETDRCYVTFTMPQGLQMEDFSLNHGTVDTSSNVSSGGDDDFYDRDEPFVPEFAKLDCLTCRGDGDCNTCGGDGYTGFGDAKAGCRTCHGDGDCRACGGSGKR